MAKTLEQLLSLSSIIANETKAGANTALRVGGLFSDIIYYLRDLDYADKDDIPSLSGYARESWVLQQGYLTGITSKLVTDALGYTPYDAANFTKAKIKSTLGISDWALASSKPSYTTKEVSENTNLYFTNARAVAALKSITDGFSGNISTLQGYFTDGVANSALKLSDNSSYTAWGQTFFTNGKPKSLSGALTDVTDIASSGTITTNKIVIGNGTIEWDESNKGFKVTGLYSTTYLSAKGANTNGGSTPSGGQYTRLDTWDGYTSAMDGWVLSAKLGKGLYDTQNSLISRVGALEGKATNVSFTQSLTSGTQIGSISIDGVAKNIYAPTIPTDDINKGVTAYGWGNHATMGYITASASITGNAASASLIKPTTGTGVASSWVSLTSYTKVWGEAFNVSSLGSDTGDIALYLRSGVYTKNSAELCVAIDGDFYAQTGSKKVLHEGNYTDYTYSKTTIDSTLSGYQTKITSSNKLAYSLISGVPTKLSQFTNDLGLGSLAYKSSLVASDIPNLDWSKITSGKPTTISGYGITDAITTANIGSQSVLSAEKLVDTRGAELVIYHSNTLYVGGGTYTSSGTHILGNDVRLRYGASAAIGLLLNSLGNVGIGTTSPSYKLDVSGSSNATTLYQNGKTLDNYYLPLSGGDINGYIRAYDYRFINNSGTYLGLLKADSNDENTLYFATRSATFYTLIHSGNIGSQSVLSAEKLVDASGAELVSSSDRTLYVGGGTYTSRDTHILGSVVRLRYGASAEVGFLLNSSGNVGVGTTSPQYKLDVSGVIHSTTGIFSDGYVSAKGQNTSSDMRLKNVLNYVVLGVKDIANAPSIRFSWKNGGGVDVGSSAQYWQGVLPDAVKERDGMLEMQYANIALLSAIALAKNFETMDERVARLEKENKELRNEINMMKGGNYA